MSQNRVHAPKPAKTKPPAAKKALGAPKRARLMELEDDDAGGGELRKAKESRIFELHGMLVRPSGATIAEMAEALATDRKGVWRYIGALRRGGAHVDEDKTGPFKRFFIKSTLLRGDSIRFSQADMVMLLVAKRAVGFLRGTGFLEQFDAIFNTLETRLERKHVVEVQNLGRKIYDLNEESYFFDGKDEDIDALLSGLLYGDQLEVRHVTHDRGKTPFKVDPYTLLLYRKGLYLVGFSHAKSAIRTWAVDGFENVDRLHGSRFEYPAEDVYNPEAHFRDVFGVFTGGRDRASGARREPELVRIRFDDRVARYVKRRQWHPSQVLVETPDGLEMHLRVIVDGERDVELRNLVLRFGSTAEVLEPESLRANIARELEAARRRYP